jgi:flagellar secretion chaperone FliS
MMPSTQAAERYLQTRVQSSQPLELVVLLYGEAIRVAEIAREAALRRDIFGRRTAVSKVLAIVSELQAMLNMEQGGQIAADLDRLYTFMTERLIEATVKDQVQPIDEVHRLLQILLDAWQEIARRPAGAPAP